MNKSNEPGAKAGIGDLFGAIYRTGNHASIEGLEIPSNDSVGRIADVSSEAP